MQDKTLSFERILSLTTLVANYLLYRYDVPIDLGESATLEVWAEHKEKILELADYSETSESEAEREVYLYIKTKARPKARCYQIKDANGKTIWKSPFNDEITGGYDTNNEETYLYLNDFDYNGLLQYLYKNNFIDQHFVDTHTEGLDTLLESSQTEADFDSVVKRTGISAEKLKFFFEKFATNQKVVSLFSMGVNQSSQGVNKANSIINCHLLTGKIGKLGAAPFSMTGQPNAMGGREVGGLANMLAAHLDLENPLHVIGRTPKPILEPEEKYEMEGLYAGCVFPTGNVVVDGTLFVYYGAADKFVGVATCKLEELVDYLLSDECKI